MTLRIKLVQSLIDCNEALIFYPRLRKLYRSLGFQGEPVIFDVGANKGQSIRLFKGLYPRATIYSFEPNQVLFDKLQRKYCDDPSIRLFAMGISDNHGRRTLNQNVMHETSTFESINLDSKYAQSKARILGVATQELIESQVECDVTTLAIFASEQGIAHIDILKIDTEGHEGACLRGHFDKSNSVTCDCIQLEQHFDDMYDRKGEQFDIHELLESQGFRRIAEIPHGFGKISELIYRRRDS